MTIILGDFQHPQVQALLKFHLEQMRANSPPGSVFALDWSGLQRPEISFYTLWEGDTLLGCGAVKDLGDGTAEIKSMRTHPEHLRKRVGEKILVHIIETTKARNYGMLLLETGSGLAFDPALALYRKHGFVNCGPFADYEKSPFNQFMQLKLDEMVTTPT
jgi:putative acetyltransferase